VRIMRNELLAAGSSGEAPGPVGSSPKPGEG
jgi:hypothetical protein